MTTTTTPSRVEHRIGTGGRFELRFVGGEVEVRGTDGELAVVEDVDGRALADRFRIEATEGSLSVAMKDGSILGLSFLTGGSRDAANLRVAVPRGASVVVETVSADVRAIDLSAGGRFKTASGDIELDGVGGTVEAATVSGDLEADASGPLALKAVTVSGDVELRAPAFTRLEASTTSGDLGIDGRLEGAGPFAIRTVSGDATIVGRSGLRVEARTVTGDLHTDMASRTESGSGRRALIVGDGEATLAFQSVSGDLQVDAPRGGGLVFQTKVRDAAIPVTPTPPVPPTPGVPPGPPAVEAASIGADDARLEVLRALERGEIDVAEAGARLAAIEEA